MTIYSDLGLLHPKFKTTVGRLADYLRRSHEAGITKTRFEVFETFRTPERQEDLRKKGTTKAGPFQSAHQFGLACDFVPYISRQEAHDLGDLIGEKVLEGYSWSRHHDWEFLRRSAQIHGLVRPMDWDLAHIEDPSWPQLRQFMKMKLE